MTRDTTLRKFSPPAAVAALLLVSGCNESTKGHSDRASEGGERAVRAVEAYNTPAYGREIQLVRPEGRRIRIDPHPPLQIDGAWSPDGTRIAFSGGEGTRLPGRKNCTQRQATGTMSGCFTAGRHLDPRGLRTGSGSRSPSMAADRGLSAPTITAHTVPPTSLSRPSALGLHGRRTERSLRFLVRTSSAVPNTTRGVYTVRVDGTGLRRLTRPLTRREITDEAGIFDVEWSPDGTHIAFVRYSDSAPADEIDIVDANGRNERRIDRGDCPVWSPDGKRLAYWAAAGGIGVVRPSRPARLIAKRKRAGCPAWFADGRRLLFFAGGPYVVNALSGSVRKATAAERKRVRLFQHAGQTFTTDGKFLDAEGDFDENHYIVHVSTLRGTVATFRWSDDSSPVWSRDHRKLAFVRLQKTEQLFIFDTIARRLRRFAAGTNPSWSPDDNGSRSNTRTTSSLGAFAGERRGRSERDVIPLGPPTAGS